MHYHLPPYKREGTLGRANVCRDFWDYNWGQEKIGQELTGASPVAIPETIVGHISVPASCSFLKWRIFDGAIKVPNKKQTP